MKFFKEIKEGYYNKRDAYQRDYDSSVAGMGKRQSYAYQQDGGANDEGWDRPEYQAPQYTYYIRFKDTGAVYKQKGVPKSFANKQAANAYAVAMMKNNPKFAGNLLLTVDAEDKPAEAVTEANYDDDNFNPRIEQTKITNLRLELSSGKANFKRKQEIEKEISEIENQLRLWQAANGKPHANKPIESDDGGPYMIYTDQVHAGQFAAHTLQGAKNVGKRAVIQQKAHVYAIVTDNNGEIVFVWYPTDQEQEYKVGGTYRPPSTGGEFGSRDDQPRYPEGHPYAGAVMPSNIPITTDWHAQEERPKESIAEGAEDLPMYGAIIHRIMVAHPDLLQKYGPEKIMAAAEDEAEWVGDVEEIGSSDVSISVKRVIQALEEQQGVAEVRRANTASARAELANRPRKELSDKEKEDKKKESDAAWERLMQYANDQKQGVAEGQTPEQEIERLKLRQNAEHGGASLKRQAETQARIRELEKQLKDKNTVEEADMSTGNQGYDNMLTVMKAVDAGQDATFNLAGEPITLEYPEARFLAGKYKAFLRAGRQEEFLKYMDDPVMFDRLMKQLRDLIDKQKNFKGSVPGERGVEEGVVDTLKAGAKKALKALTGPDDEELIQRLEKETGGKRPEKKDLLPKVDEGYYYCKISKTAKLIPEGYKKTAEGYITRK